MPIALGAITVHCPLCGAALSCPVRVADDPEAMARNELGLELVLPEHVCGGPDDAERAAA